MQIKERTFNILMAAILVIGLSVTTLYSAHKYKKAKQKEQFVKDSIAICNPYYKFIVVDDSITVYDCNTPIGTVKLEGALDSLITLDNQ